MQADALADIERIAEDLYETQRRYTFWLPWRSMSANVHEAYRATVRDMLHRDVIRVGRRPNVERPMAGQTELVDFMPDEHMPYSEGDGP